MSVFKVIQELLAPSKTRGRNQFQILMSLLPDDHKAKWFAGAALNTSEQAMSSVMSTALSRLNAFLNTELEQLLCFDTEIDAERFCNEKTSLPRYIHRSHPRVGRSSCTLQPMTAPTKDPSRWSTRNGAPP